MTYKLKSGEKFRQTVVNCDSKPFIQTVYFCIPKELKLMTTFSLTSFMDKCGKCVVNFYMFAV